MKSIFKPGAASTPPPGETSLINHYIPGALAIAWEPSAFWGMLTSQSESANKLCARYLPWADYD